MPTVSRMPRGKWSIASQDSFPSIGSSISAASLLSSMSRLSVLSHQSDGSVLSAQSRRAFRGYRVDGSSRRGR